MGDDRKLLVIQVAGLGYDFLGSHCGFEWLDMTFRPMETVFPAVTCTAQATFRTALSPQDHGMVANGVYARDLCRPLFWEQSCRLVEGPRIWESFRRRGKKVAMLFWQQSLGEDVDILLSPAPIHKHHGGMIEDCYAKPAGLYQRLCKDLGAPFRLRNYWGPMACELAGAWIAEAARSILHVRDYAPDLCLVYLPSLDYDLQRFGAAGKPADEAMLSTAFQVRLLVSKARGLGYEVLVFGDYAMGDVTGAAFPNRVLFEEGLLCVRRLGKRLYPDFHASRAFAVVDHEVAHVYVRDPGDVEHAARVLSVAPGVDRVLDRAGQAEVSLAHPRSGELVLVACRGSWFAYPWWTHRREAPDYATHVDIHNKPGYDPCELFAGTFPWSVSLDTRRIRASHGRAEGADRLACWGATCDLGGEPKTLVELAASVRAWLEAV